MAAVFSVVGTGLLDERGGEVLDSKSDSWAGGSGSRAVLHIKMPHYAQVSIYSSPTAEEKAEISVTPCGLESRRERGWRERGWRGRGSSVPWLSAP